MKINNPNFQFPIIVSKDKWNDVSKKLNQLGYRWNHSTPLTDGYPFNYHKGVNSIKIEIRDERNKYLDWDFESHDGLAEIKINNPNPTFEMWDEIKNQIFKIIDSSEWEDKKKLDDEYFDIINKITNGFGFNWNKLTDDKKVKVYNQVKVLLNKYKINEIKVNKPNKLNVTKISNEQYDIAGIEQYYGVEEDDDHITFPYYPEDRIDNYLKLKNIPFRIEETWIIIDKKYLNIKNDLQEIKRLQQLAGINEIRINKPIASEEEIVELYNKIDEYIQEHWSYDNEPATDDAVIDWDKQLDLICKEYNPDLQGGYSDISKYISTNQTKNNIFYRKLKDLDSQIDYNYNP